MRAACVSHELNGFWNDEESSIMGGVGVTAHDSCQSAEDVSQKKVTYNNENDPVNLIFDLTLITYNNLEFGRINGLKQ